MTKKKYSVFIKYLISYSLFFLLPLMIFIGIIFNIINNDLVAKAEKQGIKDLERIEYLMTYNLSSIDDIRKQIDFNEDIRETYNMLNPLAGMKTIKILRQYAIMVPLAEKIMIYYEGSNYVYSNESTYNIDFVEEILSNRIKKLLLNKEEGFLVSTENDGDIDIKGKKYIAITHDILPVVRFHKGKILFLLEKNKIRDLIKSALNDETGNLLMYSGGELIYSYNGQGIENNKGFKDFLKSDNNIQHITINGEKFIAYRVFDDAKLFEYVSYKPYNLIMKDVIDARNTYIFLIIVLFLLGTTIVFLFAKYNYKPINNIYKQLNVLYPEFENEYNEFEFIENAVNALKNQNELLDEQIRSNTNIIHEHLYHKLLKGNIDKELLHTQLEFQEVSGFQVIIFEFKDQDSLIQKKETLRDYWKENYLKNTLYIDDKIEFNKIIIILKNVNEQELNFSHVCKGIVDNYLVENYNHLKVGIGMIYEDFKDISKSYGDAIIALEYRLIDEISEVILYSDIKNNRTFISLPYSYTEDIKLSLLRGQRKNLIKTFEEIQNYIISHKISARNCRTILLNLMNEILNALTKQQRINILSQNIFPKGLKLAECDHRDKIIFNMNKILSSLEPIIEENWRDEAQVSNKKNYDYIVIKVMKEIKKSYGDSNFSIQNLADVHDVHLSNLTKHFKNVTGISIKEYLLQIKMKEATKLLIDTNKNIADISEAVGYHNASSFIRQFKSTMSMTPGEYRKQYKK